MKRVLGIAAALAFVVALAQAAVEEPKTLTGTVKVVKEGDAVKEITLTVACKADCKGCDKDCVYQVVDTKEGDVAKLDGKTAKVIGKVEEKDGKKPITAEKVEEVKA
ncbi:MAG: hypothetical protein N3A66_11940 [Planctomycetota bacterium]|nr:hypothetical protein [Planctomycetota bacterium]